MELSEGAPARVSEQASRIYAGRVDEFDLNEFRIVEMAGRSIGVVRTENGFFAVLNRCPHMGARICVGSSVTSSTVSTAPFQYEIAHENAVVRCPWHRWEFRIDSGESIGKVTRLRLLTYTVEVEGEKIYVRRRDRPKRGSAAAEEI